MGAGPSLRLSTFTLTVQGMLTADFVGVREAVSGKGSVSPWLLKEGWAVTVGKAVGVMVGASLKTAGLLALGRKATVVPGLLNKFYAWKNRLLPRSVPVRLFGFLMKRASVTGKQCDATARKSGKACGLVSCPAAPNQAD